MPEQKRYYQLPVEEAFRQLQSKQTGLSQADAEQRLTEAGRNQLRKINQESLVVKFLRQFKDLTILLLVLSAGISSYLDEPQTAIALGVVILLNTVMGFRQEYKAEKIMESLEQLVVTKTKVKRDGELQEIDASLLVPGDIVYLEEGDSVPADVRVVEVSQFSTNDFALTGESNPSRKFTDPIQADVPLGDQSNMIFMGTTVATGHAYGIVTGTGMETELGRIAGLSADTAHDDSPLQKEMNNVAQKVAISVVGLFVVILLLAGSSDLELQAAFLFAVAVAVSLVPQGLPAALSTVLAQAAHKMAGARALVKKLSAVETLGATSIICTDKTGTLTKNQMTVEQLLIHGKGYEVSGAGYEPEGHISHDGVALQDTELQKHELFFITGILASNARVNPPDESHRSWYCIGDPTEGALITLAEKAHFKADQIQKKYPELRQFAFDSARKRMSSVRDYNGKPHVFSKGAPESILERCTHIFVDGKVRNLTKADKDTLLEQNESLAQDAMRNLAFAYRPLPAGKKPEQLDEDEAESHMILLGMVSMVDPLREEVVEAMHAAHDAHMRIAVITGDYASTAKAVAKKAGLGISHDIVVVSGKELAKLDDKKVLELATRGSVIFSRVSPEDKLRIVSLVKDSGSVVAVTGDGINDAPALKRADIGVAMGVTGTDVAKQSADIILLDDSFGTLVKAVQQGRTIFQNIKKITLVAFVANFSELVINMASLIALSFFSAPLALTVMLIIAIDLISELFPLVALGWDKPEGQVMHEPPRDQKQHILNRKSIKTVIWSGTLIGLLAFANFLLFFWRRDVDITSVDQGSLLQMQASSLTYVTIMLCQTANILFMRSRHGMFTKYQFHNRKLLYAFGLSLISILSIVYLPFLQPYFQSAAITLADWTTALIATAIFIALNQLRYLRRETSNEI